MRSLALILGIGLLVTGCQSASPLDGQPNSVTSAGSRSTATVTDPLSATITPPSPEVSLIAPTTTQPSFSGSILLLGDVQSPGQRPFQAGQKISDVLATASLASPANKLTLLLVRRGPEGMTSEMLDIDQSLKLLDPSRNYDLREGDELVVSIAPLVPEGLSRPTAMEMPPRTAH